MPVFDFSYLWQGKSNSVADALIQARMRVKKNIAQKRSKANLRELEEDLNAMFANKSLSTQKQLGAQDAGEILGGEFTHMIVDRIKTYNFDATPPRRSGDTRQSFEKSTLNNAIENAQQTLIMLTQEISMLPSQMDRNTLNQLLEKVKLKIREAKNILNNSEFQQFKQTTKQRFVGDASEAINVINYLETFTKTMNAPAARSMKQLGDEFETWLVQAGNDFKTQNVKKIVGALNTGAKTIRRGGGQVSYTLDFQDWTKADAKNFNLNKGNMTITYNPGSYRQGKADVVFKTPKDSTANDYRISAKNWSHGYGDLGHTSIDAGISRSGGIGIAEAYKLAVLTGVKTMDNIANSAHDFAKLALAADIAMGISQGNQRGYGYANLLVVNAGGTIKVFDLVKIIEEVEAGSRYLSGYDEAEIESTANTIYRRVMQQRGNRTNNYLGLMTSTLNKMQVTLYVSAK